MNPDDPNAGGGAPAVDPNAPVTPAGDGGMGTPMGDQTPPAAPPQGDMPADTGMGTPPPAPEPPTGGDTGGGEPPAGGPPAA